MFTSIKSFQTLIDINDWYRSSLRLSLATHLVQASRRFPQRDFSLSFEPPSIPNDLSSRLERILGLCLGSLGLTLEHLSLHDFKLGIYNISYRTPYIME
jgi:hypothetical protein